MKSKRRLFYFTNNYPYGYGEPWKTNELSELLRYFERIDLIPFSYPSSGSKEAVNPIDGVVYHLPLLPNGVSQKSIFVKLFEVLFSAHFLYFLKEYFTKKLFYSTIKTIRWIGASHKALELKNAPALKRLFKDAPVDSIFYFFWGRETAEVLPLIIFGSKSKKIVRFHGYDLYRDVNEGYLPFQDSIINTIDTGLVCSDFGLKTLRSYYPHLEKKFFLQRIGVVAGKTSKASSDGKFRVVSCSRVIKLKRVHLIPQFLKLLDVPVEWTHIGDGPDFKDLKMIADNIQNSQLECKLLGHLSANQVAAFYANNPVDLFINVSDSEGVPVSIMEALAAGVPVMATNVGGTAELIDDKVGFLLDKDFESNVAYKWILDFMQKSEVEKNNYRSSAFSRYEEMCQVENLTRNLVKLLLN